MTTPTTKTKTRPPAALMTVDAILAGHPLARDDLMRNGASAAIRGLPGNATPAEFLAYASGHKTGRIDTMSMARAAAVEEVQAELDAAAANTDTIRAGAATAERQRIRAVLDLPEAADRQASALHLALTTAMVPGEMAELLLGLPMDAEAAAKAAQAAAYPPDMLRSCDAPGGLVLFDASTGSDLAFDDPRYSRGRAAVKFDPIADRPPTEREAKAEKTAGAWSKAVADVNAKIGHGDAT